MCDPVSAAIVIGGMATSAIATNNQTKSANRNLQARQTAKENAYRAGMERQQGYADEAGQAFKGSIQEQGGDGFADELAAGTDRRLQAFNETKQGTPDYAVASSAPKNVALAREQAFGDASDKTDRDNSGLAALEGYGDALFNTGLARNEYARAFGNLSDKAQRDANLIGMDISAADRNAYKGPNAAVGMMGTLGKLAASYGAAGSPGLQYNPAGGSLPAGVQGPVQPKLQTTPALGGYSIYRG